MIQCWSRLPAVPFVRPRILGTQTYYAKRTAPRVSSAYYTPASSTLLKGEAECPAKNPVFQRLYPPPGRNEGDPETWIALLDPALPPHLRQYEHKHCAATLSAADLAEIILAARRTVLSKKGTDILTYMGMRHDRWRAVVWIVKYLVESLPHGTQPLAELSHLPTFWNDKRTLNDLTKEGSIEIGSTEVVHHDQTSPLESLPALQEMTDIPRPRNSRNEEVLKDAVLGQIWRSLGAMMLGCTDGIVKPEVLEIIAYLHHQGIMPSSIYNSKPRKDETAIQQPPTLHLLSSRILTSLSDAAWRAHERLVVEEARSKGGNYKASGPEVRGSAYRVNVAGLRYEIWLELILWSCIHGGWILEGARLLAAICEEPEERQWKALSWRSLIPTDQDDFHEWDEVDFLFRTKPTTVMDLTQRVHTDVRRTISSEVVNAYVDALLNTLDVGVGDSGAPQNFLIDQMILFRKFLEQSGLKLAGGSANAVILRCLEYRGDDAIANADFKKLMHISPGFGREVDIHHVPSYVLDGNAATIGIAHRALRQETKAGNLRGALGVLRQMQDYTDTNKRKSLEEFFRAMRVAETAASGRDGPFTSNFSKIEYPAFDMQIPPTILGPFLDLCVDTESYDVAKWLLYSEDLDGPLIPESYYSDPAITPALVTFAAKTNDRALLSRVVELQEDGPTARRNIQSFLANQFALKRWDAAIQILEYMRDSKSMNWNVVNLSSLAHIMLQLRSKSVRGDVQSRDDLSRAEQIFTKMVQGDYDNVVPKPKYKNDQVSILLAVLASTDRYWANFCLRIRQPQGHYKFDLTVKAFNRILEGVVETSGSAAGRLLLGKFWPHSVRRAQAREQQMTRRGAGTPRSRYPSLGSADRQRTIIHLGGHPSWRTIIYGGLRPNLATIRIIFRGALDEFKQGKGNGNKIIDSEPGAFESAEAPTEPDQSQSPAEESERTIDTSPSAMVVWAVRSFRGLGLVDEDIREELRLSLPEHLLQNLEAQLPWLFEQAEEEEAADVSLKTRS